MQSGSEDAENMNKTGNDSLFLGAVVPFCMAAELLTVGTVHVIIVTEGLRQYRAVLARVLTVLINDPSVP